MQPPSKPDDAVRQYVRELLASDARRCAEINQRHGSNPLVSVVQDWWCGLPVITRNRRFAMTEISDALYAQTRHRNSYRDIAAALEALNWTTGRDWTRAGRNRRYWKPPQQLQGGNR